MLTPVCSAPLQPEEQLHNLTTQHLILRAAFCNLLMCRDQAKAGMGVFMMTDKSKKITADTAENHIEAMKVHIKDDVTMNKDDLAKLEREMNGHTVMFSKILSIGRDWGHEARVKSAVTSKQGYIPKLTGLRKYHQVLPPGQEVVGPPCRPVCGASKSVNGPLSNILSEILNTMADQLDKAVGTECRSTEELVAGMEEVNNRNDVEKPVVFSMDVNSLYPSLKAKQVAEEISAVYLELELEVEVDTHQLGLYLVMVAGREEMVRQGLKHVTPTRRHTGGSAPGITTAEVFGGEDCDTKFIQARRKPTKGQRRKMMALAIKLGIVTVMKNHTYRFNGKVYLQEDGGPIGLELSGALARVFMLAWDRRLLRTLKKAMQGISWTLYMLLRYVDDSNAATDEVPLGARFENGKVKIKKNKVEEDRQVPGDVRTARLVQEIANGICNFIKMEIDCPSMNPDNKVPILDLKVGVQGDKIVYEHYRKPCASYSLIMANSAMPDHDKRVCLVQEIIRIMRNTSKLLPKEVTTTLLSEFSFRMKESGYTEYFRLEVISSGMAGFKKQLQRDADGVCPLYRPKGYKESERRKKKILSKTSWYRPYNTVMFCPPTPGSTLALKLRSIVKEEEKRTGIKVKVVERAGVKLQHMLPGLPEAKECEKKKCFMHLTGGKEDHLKEGAVYRGDCMTCKEVGPGSYPNPDREGEVVLVGQADKRPGTKSSYWGETGRSILVRGAQHLDSLEKPEQHTDNAFVKHSKEYHNEQNVEDVKFKLTLVDTYAKAMEREVCEGVVIRRGEAEVDIVMNSKLDHYAPAVGRMVISSGVREGQRRLGGGGGSRGGRGRA